VNFPSGQSLHGVLENHSTADTSDPNSGCPSRSEIRRGIRLAILVPNLREYVLRSRQVPAMPTGKILAGIAKYRWDDVFQKFHFNLDEGIDLPPLKWFYIPINFILYMI